MPSGPSSVAGGLPAAPHSLYEGKKRKEGESVSAAAAKTCTWLLQCAAKTGKTRRVQRRTGSAKRRARCNAAPRRVRRWAGTRRRERKGRENERHVARPLRCRGKSARKNGRGQIPPLRPPSPSTTADKGAGAARAGCGGRAGKRAAWRAAQAAQWRAGQSGKGEPQERPWMVAHRGTARASGAGAGHLRGVGHVGGGDGDCCGLKAGTKERALEGELGVSQRESVRKKAVGVPAKDTWARDVAFVREGNRRYKKGRCTYERG